MKSITSFFLLSTLCVLQHVALVANSQPGKSAGGQPGKPVESQPGKPVGGQPGKPVEGQPGKPSGPVSGNLIEEACKHSQNKDVCISDLKKDPSSQGADLIALALIGIRQASAHAADVDFHLRMLMMKDSGMPDDKGRVDQSSLDPTVEQAVVDCANFYSDANEQLDDTQEMISGKQFKEIEMRVKVAMSDASGCAHSLNGQQTVIAEKTQKFVQLCDNVSSVIQGLIQKG